MLFISKTWLKVSMSARIHTKERAFAVWCWIWKRTERGSHKERYIEAEQDSAEADKEWRGEMIFDDDIEWEGQRTQAGDQRTS